MPWKEASIVSLRQEFILEAQRGNNLRALCRQHGVSPTTAYKWLSRSANGEDLTDRSRHPKNSPQRLSDQVRERVLTLKEQHPTWGARKLTVLLSRDGVRVSEASVHRILRVNGLIKRKGFPQAWRRFERECPNELWQLDFKGHAALSGQATRLHPLTLIDDHSRFLVRVAALAGEREKLVWPQLVLAFQQYGMPVEVLCDNGGPWGRPADAFTLLERKLIRYGVRVTHGQVRHPQTQGKLERLHRTLDEDLLSRKTFSSLREAQAFLDVWREEYNTVRPHEGIGFRCPAELYLSSSRVFPERPPVVQYDSGDVLRRVQAGGFITFAGREYRVGKAFKGEVVALRPTEEDGVLSVWYCSQQIKLINQP